MRSFSLSLTHSLSIKFISKKQHLSVFPFSLYIYMHAIRL